MTERTSKRWWKRPVTLVAVGVLLLVLLLAGAEIWIGIKIRRTIEREAAALTGLDEKIVRQAIRQGELIACYAHSSTKRIRRRDLDDWISSLPERPQ